MTLYCFSIKIRVNPHTQKGIEERFFNSLCFVQNDILIALVINRTTRALFFSLSVFCHPIGKARKAYG